MKDRIVTFHFGTQYCRDGEPVGPITGEFAIEAIKKFAAETFGGYSLQHIDGGWRNPATGKITHERGAVLEIIVTTYSTNYIEYARNLKKMAWIISDELKQAAVYIVERECQAELFEIAARPVAA